MPSRYRFLVHDVFQKQLDDFLEANQEAWSSLLTQIKKTIDNPLSAGRMMHDVPAKKLQGKIHRLHVKGRRGFRFIYIVEPRSSVVVGVFVSTERRSKFDYSDVPWERIASDIYEDLTQSKWERFREFVVPS